MPDDQITAKPGNKYASIKRPRVYRALRRQGYSKESAARISNAKSYTLDEFTAIALKEGGDPVLVTAAAMHTPGLLTLKGTQLAPGVTRIKGDLCNVHGRWGSCRAAGYGGATPSKRVPPRKLPAAPKPKAGGRKRAAGGKKGGTGRAAAKLTSEQRATARQAEHAQNTAKVLHDLGIPEDAAGALADLRAGKPVADDGGLVKMGLAEQGKDGSYRLTSTGRAFLSAAEAGDAGRARDALGRAADQEAGREERAASADERKRATAERQAAVAARRAEAERKRQERLAKQKKGGGGRKKKEPQVNTAPRAPLPRSSVTPRPVIGGGRSLPPQQQPKKPLQLPRALQDAVQTLSDGKPIDDATAALLIRNGLARYNKDGVLVLTAAGLRATKKEAALKTPSPGDYLVVEDPTKPSTYHLQVKRNGTPDHRLMGSAWAALHGGFRGNVYQGPNKQDAIAKLKRLYASEGMDVPRGKSYSPQIRRVSGVGVSGVTMMVSPTVIPNTDRHFMQRTDSLQRGAHQRTQTHPQDGQGNSHAVVPKKDAAALAAPLTVGIGASPVGSIPPSFAVFKDAKGQWRWIARTTTAYRDRDGEIISEKALEDDAARMTAAGIYGPLRYWHVGVPDPLSVDQPWGPGLDIGACDYSIVIGRTSIESGTFKTEALGRAFASSSSSFELSPGFFHAPTEPDAATGVFHHIRRFERSVVPTAHGRASNLFTGLTVKEHRMDQATYKQRVDAYLDFAREKGIPPEDAAAPLVAMEQADKEAKDKNIAYKEEGGKKPIFDFFRAFFSDEQAPQTTTKEEEAAPEIGTPPPDPTASFKAELDALRAEIAALKGEETEVETQADAPMEEVDESSSDDGGLTLSSDDLAAIGQMFGGVLQSALEPLVGALGITQKLDGHMAELKTLMGGYVKQKEAGDSARTDTIAALKATIDQQQAAIAESQAKLTELLGDQPRNAGYRPSHAADNGAEQLLAAIKEGPDGPTVGGPFDDLIANLFPGLAQGGK